MSDEWQVTEEALAAMETAAAGMEETNKKLKADIKALESAFQENEGGLGAHSDDISSLLEDLQKIGEEAAIPVKKLILKMAKSILIRRAHMEKNSYSRGRSR